MKYDRAKMDYRSTNGRVRTPGKTVCELYPWGEPKRIKSIEFGKQVNNTKESVIDTLIHEELEARIMMRAGKNEFYNKLNGMSEVNRHKYINKVIKRYFKGKGWNYDLV